MGQTCYPERHEINESNMHKDRKLSSTDSTLSSDSYVSTEESKMMYTSWKNAIELAQIPNVKILLRQDEIYHFLNYHWDDGSSALQIACKKQHHSYQNLARFLLKQHVDVNEQNTETLDTALHIAVRNENTKLVELLLEWKADKNIKNKKGETPISITTNRHIYFILTGDSNWFPLIGVHAENLIPTSLQNELKNECMSLMAAKDQLDNQKIIEIRDQMNHRKTKFPKSYNVQIQNLIEPCKTSYCQLESSLNYCKVDRRNSYSNSSYDRELQNEIEPSVREPSFDVCEYQPRIPAVFRLNQGTNLYEIQSDINDLPKRKYANLYSVIERIFNHMVSHIRDKMESDEYYVVVKMTDFQFVDSNNSFYRDDDFHFEGFEKEYIKEIALYYFDISDNVSGGGLIFKDEVTYGTDGLQSTPELGKNTQRVAVKDNDCVFFTNEHPLRHKKDGMSMYKRRRWNWVVTEDETKDEAELYTNNSCEKVFGTHKVLAFYIADTTKHDEIKTSKDVVVNFESKMDQIVDYWMREVKLMSNGDVSKEILKFACDAELIKIKTEANRQRRLAQNQQNVGGSVFR